MSGALAEFRTFLDRVLPDDYAKRYADYRTDRALRLRFQQEAFAEGWLIPEWERGDGGRSLATGEALEVRLEGARRRIPRLLNVQGAGVAAPALRTFGTSEQKAQYLRACLRGDEIWALGMSEPEAGSDLASLRTTAERRGDVYVVNGQKVWTTQADEARWCALYVRTDPEQKRHRGISCLILDMTLPGITVRPISTAGPAVESFCEVFLDGVEVPVSHLLGAENGGWAVAVSSLEHERDMIWINNWLELQRGFEPVATAPELAAHHLVAAGSLMADSEALRLTGMRTAGERAAGRDTPAFSILKVLGSESVQAATAMSLEVAGVAGLLDSSLFDERLESLAATIYGGTSEIQRDIIAERVLGLPRER